MDSDAYSRRANYKSNVLRSYVKIGRLVFVNIRITVNSVSGAGSGYLYITGAPFTESPPASQTTNYGETGVTQYNTVCATEIKGIAIQGVIFYLTPTGVTANAEIQAQAQAGQLSVCCTYFAA